MPKDTQGLSKGDLVRAVANRLDAPQAGKQGVAAVVDATLDIIAETLAKKEEVRLSGIGVLLTAERKESIGRNPRTGEDMRIPASTTVRFRPAKAIKDRVNAPAL